MLFRLVWQDIWCVGTALVQLGSSCVRCQCMWLTGVLQGVARVQLVQLWLSFGLYCGGLTAVGSVFVHQVIQRGGGLMWFSCGSDLVHAFVE